MSQSVGFLCLIDIGLVFDACGKRSVSVSVSVSMPRIGLEFWRVSRRIRALIANT